MRKIMFLLTVMATMAWMDIGTAPRISSHVGSGTFENIDEFPDYYFLFRLEWDPGNGPNYAFAEKGVFSAQKDEAYDMVSYSPGSRGGLRKKSLPAARSVVPYTRVVPHELVATLVSGKVWCLYAVPKKNVRRLPAPGEFAKWQYIINTDSLCYKVTFTHWVSDDTHSDIDNDNSKKTYRAVESALHQFEAVEQGSKYKLQKRLILWQGIVRSYFGDNEEFRTLRRGQEMVAVTSKDPDEVIFNYKSIQIRDHEAKNLFEIDEIFTRPEQKRSDTTRYDVNLIEIDSRGGSFWTIWQPEMADSTWWNRTTSESMDALAGDTTRSYRDLNHFYDKNYRHSDFSFRFIWIAISGGALLAIITIFILRRRKSKS